MKHLPRSEKFWVYAIVGFAAFLVIAASVSAVRAWRGDTPPPPQYENAPPVRLAPPDESGIVDLANAQRPPISDADFLALHRGTRLLMPRLMRDNWREALGPLVSNRRVLRDVADELAELRDVVGKARLSEPQDLYLTRPVDGKAESGGRLVAAAVGDGGQITSESTFSFTFFWTKQSGRWKIFGLVPKFSAEAGADPGGADGITPPSDQQPDEELPDEGQDDVTSGGGDGVSDTLDDLEP